MKALSAFALFFCFLFGVHAQYTTVGTTTTFGNNCFRLTQALNGQNGSVWNNSSINLNQSFDLQFQLYFGTNDGNGADGIAFVLHNQTTGTGIGGGGVGYGGITPSVVLEFDTWQNSNYGDPSNDHIALQSGGSSDHNTANNLAGPVQVLNGVNNIEDGNNYNVRVTWNATSQTFKVYVNCQLRLTYTGNIVANAFNNNPTVYWGLTASTGGANNEQRVCMQSVTTNVGGSDSTLICSGDTVQLFSKLNSPTASFVWIPNSFINDSTLANPQVWPTATTTYILKVTDTCGTTYDTTVVQVTNQYNADFSINDTFCITDPAFTITPLNSLGYFTGNGITDSSGIFFPDSAGVGTHQITHTIPGNCANDSIKSVTVLGLPDVTITAPDELCVTDTVTLTAATPNGVWTGLGINSSTGLFTGSNGIGNRLVTYTVNQPCYSQNTDTIKVVNPYTPDILKDVITLCEGDTITIQASPNNGSTQSSGTPSITWTGNGIISGSNGEFDANITGTGGPYKIFYTVAIQNGSCAGTDSALVTVYPNANSSFSKGPFCDNINKNTSVNPLFNNGNWNVTAVPPATGTFDPTAFKPSVVGKGKYILTHTIPNSATANGCGSTTTDTITILEAPTAPAVTPDSFCLKLPITLNANQQFDSLIWYTDNSGKQVLTKGQTYVLDAGDPLLKDKPIRIYTRAYNGICKSNLRETTLKINPFPDALFITNADTYYVPANIQFVNNSSSANNESFEWDFESFGTSTEKSPILTTPTNDPKSFIARLIVTNKFGCQDTLYKTIYLDVNKIGVWPPNVITPNGDGCNDVFGNNEMSNCSGHSPFPFVVNAKEYTVLIFNRWGRKIYEFKKDEYWDGGNHSAGTYFYIVKVTSFDDKVSTFKGHLTLLRDE